VKYKDHGLILESGKYDTAVINAAEFMPFNGKHPDIWPVELELPRSVYMSHDGTIYETTTEIDGTECKTYAAEFLVKKSASVIHNLTGLPEYSLKMDSLGWEDLTTNNAAGRKTTYGGKAQWTGGNENWRLLEMTWYDERDMGDYSYGEIRITP
jgi:hypothetical protein